MTLVGNILEQEEVASEESPRKIFQQTQVAFVKKEKKSNFWIFDDVIKSDFRFMKQILDHGKAHLFVSM